MSIFVSIVSYKDTELVPTIKSLMENAKNPDSLCFAVVSQDLKNKHPDLSFVKNLSYIKMDSRESRGAGYARKIAMDLYKGEDYFLQVDSHMRAAENWDSEMIGMYFTSCTLAKTNKVILSQFPSPYEIHTDGKIFYPKNHEELWDRPSWSRVHNRDHGAWSAQRQEIEDLSKPHPSHTILAGYLFAPGNFVKEIPYDERISFMGEELCIAIRSYTRGWKIYAPNKMLLWHYYKRKRSPKVWDQVEDVERPLKWIEMEMNSKKVQKEVLLGIEQGIYGIEDYEKFWEYQELIGINFADFYKNEMNNKVNSSVKTQEIIF
jgi:hypothetical protein